MTDSSILYFYNNKLNILDLEIDHMMRYTQAIMGICPMDIEIN